MLCQNWPSFEEVGKPNVYLAVMETVTGNSFVSFACFLSNDVYKLILKTKVLKLRQKSIFLRLN